ncbi:MAG TPA: ATP-grasp domain-containing protein [Casimicrobiaceae bacterium]|nr:ATP-grasp domain-containing protein [Casimicrobiaceae bacterium]
MTGAATGGDTVPGGASGARGAKPSVLLLSTATRWLGTARMPRMLARAGFDVALLTPRDSLAEKSRYVSRIGFLSPTTTPMEWLFSLIQFVEAVSPRLVIPCDEMVVRLLIALVDEPPAGIEPEVKARLTALITDSMGDPRFYATSIDKTLLTSAAEALGVRVPPHAVATDAQDATAHAEALGYPLVLKRRFGFAGQGVEIVRSRDELVRALPQLSGPDQLDLGELRPPQFLMQKFITGPYHSQALVALRGVPLAGFGWERFAATAAEKGQTTLLRFVHSPETRAASDTLCREFGMSGFFNVQFVIDRSDGKAYLLEINRRVVTHIHLGERVGRDLGKALFAALDGAPVAEEAAGDGKLPGPIVVFPREWLRDPRSPLLTEFPVDVPWDDPELLEAMLALRHEQQ